MEYKLDFRELEEKYDYKIKYSGVYRLDIKTRLMEKFICVYEIMRKKLVRLFPLSAEEEMYNSFRRKRPLKKEPNSPENKEESFFTNKFIHMYDFVPKENMERLIREVGQFKKKHVKGSGGIGDEDEKASVLKSFFAGSFLMPIYSFGIKEKSPLYNYISEIYIGFQELTTSINTVLYTIVLNKKLIKKVARRCNNVTDFCISNSDFETNVFKEAYWTDTPVLLYGHARNDILLNQTLDYINNNIEYRSSIENYKVQSRTLFFTFISMAVATLALIVTCMTSDDVSNFIADCITSIFEWINAMLRYVGRYRNCM